MNNNTVIVNTTSQDIYLLKSDADYGASVKDHQIEEMLLRCHHYPKPAIPSFCNMRRMHSGNINFDAKFNITNMGVVDLPPRKDGTIYIVTNIVYTAYSFLRDDIYITDEPVKDSRGGIRACRALARPRYVAIISELSDILHVVKSVYERESISEELEVHFFNAIMKLENLIK